MLMLPSLPFVGLKINQAALLYTTSCGERRIRVHNLAIPVETVIQNIFDSVNIDVLCNILAKQALEVRMNIISARSQITLKNRFGHMSFHEAVFHGVTKADFEHQL